MSSSRLFRSSAVAFRTRSTNAPLSRAASVLAPTDTFASRHIGPSDAEIAQMLKVCGLTSLDALVDTTVPKGIRLKSAVSLEPARSETEALAHLQSMIGANELKKSFIGKMKLRIRFSTSWHASTRS